MKLFFVVLDGVADEPIKEFGNSTPLEAAETPNLDYLASNGITGRIRIMGKYAPETDTGVMALFGFDPLKYHRGRGPLEAYGIGYNFKEGSLALRGNFATVEKNRVVDKRAGRIQSKEARKLVNEINDNVKLEDVKFELLHALNYRVVLIMKTTKFKFSHLITNTHPGYKRLRGHLEVAVKKESKMYRLCKPLVKRKSAILTAKVVNEFIDKTREVLEQSSINKRREKRGLKKANMILFRGAGTELPKLENLKKKYGLKWFCIGDTPAERGIARLLGMELIKGLPEPECDKLSSSSNIKEIKKAVRKDMRIRAKAVKDNLSRYDAFYLHIKGADPFGHAGLPEHKRVVIEGIDKWLIKKLVDLSDLENDVVIITSDHTTSCVARAHTATPVPVLIAGRGMESDNINKFGESFVKRGSLKTIKATQILEAVMDRIGDFS
ncbi:MAG TPA: 2,3-bisphosphoglycerate-independent phosphoglycerate mutase [Candidatus Aenigmarchaeota archaeon]|nr:2,3-bisphosphoglycerate-independent phosphoglycerate mutase [Candidatus Aenigmarchaeota archaeon]